MRLFAIILISVLVFYSEAASGIGGGELQLLSYTLLVYVNVVVVTAAVDSAA